jgi:hypothetical protein
VIVHQIEDGLAAAGFIDVRIIVKQGSRQLVETWVPGRGIGDYVAFADDRRPQGVIKPKYKRHINSSMHG